MNLNLSQKIALIVGATGSIGQSISEMLASEGCSLILCARNKKELERLRNKLTNLYPDNIIYTIAANVEKATDSYMLFSKCIDYCSKIDILINCIAGPEVQNQFFDNQNENKWRKAINGKLLSYIRIINSVLPIMKLQYFGRIISIVGLSAREPSSQLLMSGVINAGIINFTKTLAKVYGPYNILFSCINPGCIASRRFNNFLQYQQDSFNLSYDESIERIKQNIPVNRIGIPEDIAALVAFLSSDMANYITGTTICVDGGLSQTAF